MHGVLRSWHKQIFFFFQEQQKVEGWDVKKERLKYKNNNLIIILLKKVKSQVPQIQTCKEV